MKPFRHIINNRQYRVQLEWNTSGTFDATVDAGGFPIESYKELEALKVDLEIKYNYTIENVKSV